MKVGKKSDEHPASRARGVYIQESARTVLEWSGGDSGSAGSVGSVFHCAACVLVAARPTTFARTASCTQTQTFSYSGYALNILDGHGINIRIVLRPKPARTFQSASGVDVGVDLLCRLQSE